MIKKLIIAIIILAVIIAAAVFLFRPKAKIPDPIKIDTTNQPTMGKANATVHIVAFEDLKCGNCMRYNTQLFPKIKKRFIDTGIAKYTMITVAFIPGSLPAANAARCLYEQNKTFFFPFIKYVYDHQPPESQNWANAATLLAFASHVPGIDKQKLEQCIIKSPYTGFVQNNFKQAAKVMPGGVVATPTIYVNGRLVKPLTMRQITVLVKAAK